MTATYIGFQAYRSSENDVGYESVVVYDTVLANVGDGYNSGDGRFTCPVTGYYFFQVIAWSQVSFHFNRKFYNRYQITEYMFMYCSIF